jgi:hypothetical protein
MKKSQNNGELFKAIIERSGISEKSNKKGPHNGA